MPSKIDVSEFIFFSNGCTLYSYFFFASNTSKHGESVYDASEEINCAASAKHFVLLFWLSTRATKFQRFKGTNIENNSGKEYSFNIAINQLIVYMQTNLNNLL